MTEFENKKLKSMMVSPHQEVRNVLGRVDNLDIEGIKELEGQLNWIEAAVAERRHEIVMKMKEANKPGL